MSPADSGKCFAKIFEKYKMCKCNGCSVHGGEFKSHIYQVTIKQ